MIAISKEYRVKLTFRILVHRLTDADGTDIDAKNLQAPNVQQICLHRYFFLIFDVSCKSLQIKVIIRFREVLRNSARRKLPQGVLISSIVDFHLWIGTR